MRTLAVSMGVVRHVWGHPANRGRRSVMLGRAIRFQLRGRLLGERTLTPIGARSQMWAELHRNGSSQAVYANPPDMEMTVWQRILHSGDLFIDVGANVGSYTLIAAEQGAEVICIEPDPESAARLRENIALNGYSADVIECAVGATNGRTGFTRGLDTVNHIDPAGSRQVEIRTLDSIIGDRKVRGLKIDVEGYELEVLHGVYRALSEHRIDALQLEWNSMSVGAVGRDRRPIAETLQVHGYRLERLQGNTLQPLDDLGFGSDVFAFAPAVYVR